MLIPNSIMRHFRNPGAFQVLFMTYLEDAQLRFDNSKTLATNTLYDQRPTNGTPQINFFSGATLVPGNTNVPGNSFRRPESEHFLIFGIRGLLGDNADPSLAGWLRGWSGFDASLSNSNFDVTINNVRALKRVPAEEFNDIIQTKDVGLMMLSNCILWPGQQELSVLLSNEGNNTIDIGTNSLRMELVGIGLV